MVMFVKYSATVSEHVSSMPFLSFCSHSCLRDGAQLGMVDYMVLCAHPICVVVGLTGWSPLLLAVAVFCLLQVHEDHHRLPSQGCDAPLPSGTCYCAWQILRRDLSQSENIALPP